MSLRVRAFALYNSRKDWLGGALYPTREQAEEMLREFLKEEPLLGGYDSVIELTGDPPRIGTAADLGCEVLL